MEIEIANYLNRCSEGRLSNEGKHRIASMLRIVSEIESIADCCYGVAKILIRKQESRVKFNEEIYTNVDSMFIDVEAAMANMLLLLSDVENVHEKTSSPPTTASVRSTTCATSSVRPTSRTSTNATTNIRPESTTWI